MAEKKKTKAPETPETPETLETAETADTEQPTKKIPAPLIHTLTSNSVKVAWDSEKGAYRLKTLGKTNAGLLKYIGRKNGEPVQFGSPDEILALVRKVEAKAELLAKLYETE